MVINTDYDRILELVRDLNRLTNEYNSIFARLKQNITQYHEWSGKDAVVFKNECNELEEKIRGFSTKISSISNKISDGANRYKETAADVANYAKRI